MKKYENYKDSNQYFLGKIPSHWFSTTLKRIAEVKDGTHDTPSYVEEDGIPFITTKDLSNGNISFENCKYISYDDYLSINKRSNVENGDIIMPMIGSIGSPIIVKTEKPFSIKNLALIKKNRECDLRYICYYLNSEATLYQFGLCTSGGVQNFISLGVLRNLGIPKMEKEEQTAIANYLDHKTAQIDTLIAKKQQFISLLQEERTALINQAVTKGLEPKVKMKDSGIEWLGEIPEHWVEARIKNVVNIIGRIGFRGYTVADLVQKGEGAISLSPSNIKNHILNIEDCTYLSWEKYHESPEIKIFENDIILVKTGSTIGKTAIIQANTPEMTLNPQLIVFKDIKLNPLFLYYMMVSNYFQGYFSIYTAGGSTPAISQEKINNFKITFPKIEEQIQISNFIAKKQLEIKSIITKSQQEIELLKEYKTALISEVVTGKVDVRNEKLN